MPPQPSRALIQRPPRPSSVKATRQSRPEHDRRTTIAKVLALWQHEIEDESVSGRERILVKLRRALRAERRRGLSGHWTYDLARHVELLRVYREELGAVTDRLSNNRAAENPTALRAARRES